MSRRAHGARLTLDGSFSGVHPSCASLTEDPKDGQAGRSDTDVFVTPAGMARLSAREFQRYTGGLETAREIYPRFRRFFDYLRTLRDADGLLRCENRVEVFYGSVEGMRSEDKVCSFNIKALWGLREGLIPLAEALGRTDEAREYRTFADELLANTLQHFWNTEIGAFVNNLPRLQLEKTPVMDELTLTFSLMAGRCPPDRIGATLDLLEKISATAQAIP